MNARLCVATEFTPLPPSTRSIPRCCQRGDSLEFFTKIGEVLMNVVLVHPGPLMYTKIYMRLEPLGLELAAQAARQAGHQVKLIDLQAETHADYFKIVDRWRPDVVAFSCNYLANVPEIVDLAKLTKEKLP